MAASRDRARHRGGWQEQLHVVLTDSVKDPTFGKADKLDFAAYFGAWVAGLLQHPLCYLEAYLGV